jgi:hypothetical protein
MTKDTGISDKQARELLRRAAEIDRAAADVVTIETLRAAAQEAGIAESSFEAALGEQSQEGARDRAALSRRRRLVGALAGVGTAGLLLLGLAFLARMFP